MKLSPRGVKFCPGCPNSLKLTPAPEVVVKPVEKKDTKIITLSNKPEKKLIGGLF